MASTLKPRAPEKQTEGIDMADETPVRKPGADAGTLSAHGMTQLAAALAHTDQPLATLATIDLLGTGSVGHCLFSANAFRVETMEVERLYSSNPEAYPVGGRKPKKATAWGRQVLLDRRIFVGEGDQAIREFFDDHALMCSLGVHSIVNVPVVWRGACLGVLNFASPHPRFGADQIAMARMFGLIAVPAFLA